MYTQHKWEKEYVNPKIKVKKTPIHKQAKCTRKKIQLVRRSELIH